MQLRKKGFTIGIITDVLLLALSIVTNNGKQNTAVIPILINNRLITSRVILLYSNTNKHNKKNVNSTTDKMWV